MSPRVGLAAVGPRDAPVQSVPGVEAGGLRVPGEGAVVGVPGGDDAGGALGDAAHLAEYGDGVGDVLEELVGVDDVEGTWGEGEGVGVEAGEGQVGDGEGGGEGPGLVEDGLDGVASGDVALRDEAGEVDGDGAGAAAEVEDLVGGFDVREEEGGGVAGGAEGVVGYDGGVVAVGVGGLFFGHGAMRMREVLSHSRGQRSK